MSKPWVRLYRSTLHSPKVQRMGLEMVGFWANCLMSSDDDGLLPNYEDLSWVMRLSIGEVTEKMVTLESHGLVTRDSHDRSRFRLHDWDDHQHASDGDPTATERKRRQREREKQSKNINDLDTSRVTVTPRHADVTRTDTDTDTDTEKKKEESVVARKQVSAPSPEPEILPAKPKKPTKGTRWPADAVVPDDWIEAGDAYRETAGLSSIDLRAEALKFANYWASKSGGSATKVDWKRTWLNWALTARGQENGKSNRQSGKSSVAGEVFGRIYADARAQREAAGE